MIAGVALAAAVFAGAIAVGTTMESVTESRPIGGAPSLPSPETVEVKAGGALSKAVPLPALTAPPVVGTQPTRVQPRTTQPRTTRPPVVRKPPCTFCEP